MAEISLNINGQNYDMECDDGQERRVLELGDHVDSKIREIASAGAATSENHLLVLTALMLTDEIFEMREHMSESGMDPEAVEKKKRDELFIAESISQLAARIESLAAKAQKA